MPCQGNRKDHQPCRQEVDVSERIGLCRQNHDGEGQAAPPDVQVLTREDIFIEDSGIVILNEPIQTDEGPVLIIPISQEGDEAPWGGTLKWADERPMCTHIQNFLQRGTQPPWNKCAEYKDGMCQVASLGGPMPYLFHEEPDSEAWEQARDYRRIPCSTDTDPDGWGLAHKDDVYYPGFEGQELDPIFAQDAEDAMKQAIGQVREK